MSEENLTNSLKNSIVANKNIRQQTLAMIEKFQNEIPTPKYSRAALKFYQSLLASTKQQTENTLDEIKYAKEKYMISLKNQLEKVKKEAKLHSDQIAFMRSVRRFDIDSNSLSELSDFLQNKISFLDNEIDQNHKKVQMLKAHLHELQVQNFEKRNKLAQEIWQNELSSEKETNEINAPIQRRSSGFIQASHSSIVSSKFNILHSSVKEKFNRNGRTISSEIHRIEIKK